MNVTTRAWLSLVVITLIEAVLLFGAAGTLRYWQASVYIVVYVASSFFILRDLIRRDPALLQRRLRGGPTAEKSPTQRVAMVFATIGFVGVLVVPALDRRFGWSRVPIAIELGGDLLVALWFYICFLVFRANPHSAATVEVVDGQTVVATGPYAVVRHPMYAGGVLFFFGSPLALGSWWGLLAFLVAMPALVWRMFDEEKMLRKDLPGYADYTARVRSRLVPGLF